MCAVLTARRVSIGAIAATASLFELFGARTSESNSITTDEKCFEVSSKIDCRTVHMPPETRFSSHVVLGKLGSRLEVARWTWKSSRWARDKNHRPDVSGSRIQLRKVAVVTGAGKGPGRAITLDLAGRRCSVIGTCPSQETLHLIDTIVRETAVPYESQAQNGKVTQVFGFMADIFSPDRPIIIADAVEKQLGCLLIAADGGAMKRS